MLQYYTGNVSLPIKITTYLRKCTTIYNLKRLVFIKIFIPVNILFKQYVTLVYMLIKAEIVLNGKKCKIKMSELNYDRLYMNMLKCFHSGARWYHFITLKLPRILETKDNNTFPFFPNTIRNRNTKLGSIVLGNPGKQHFPIPLVLYILVKKRLPLLA